PSFRLQARWNRKRSLEKSRTRGSTSSHLVANTLAGYLTILNGFFMTSPPVQSYSASLASMSFSFRVLSTYTAPSTSCRGRHLVPHSQDRRTGYSFQVALTSFFQDGRVDLICW